MVLSESPNHDRMSTGTALSGGSSLGLFTGFYPAYQGWLRTAIVAALGWAAAIVLGDDGPDPAPPAAPRLMPFTFLSPWATEASNGKHDMAAIQEVFRTEGLPRLDEFGLLVGDVVIPQCGIKRHDVVIRIGPITLKDRHTLSRALDQAGRGTDPIDVYLLRPRDGVWAELVFSCTSVAEEEFAQPQVPLGALADRDGLNSFVNSVGIRMVELPAGTFSIGSGQLAMEDGFDPGAAGIRTQSGFGNPVHAVTVTRAFAIGEHEVTQGQWEKVIGTRPWQGQDSIVSDPQRPAVFVCWADAVAFCDKLTAAERAAQTLPDHRYYSLPTEAEWEYACRAGRPALWHNGDDETRVGAVAWHGVDWLRSTLEPDLAAKAGPQAVGQKQANRWGLFDMHGNVSEWCIDWYGPYASREENDPRGPQRGLNRVVRGGSWADDSKRVSAAWRGSQSPDTKNEFVGFRLALVKTPVRLGVSLASSPQREAGLKILHVTDGSVAEQAGLAVGDVILTANERPMNNQRAFALLLGEVSPGDSIRFTIRRADSEIVKDVQF